MIVDRTYDEPGIKSVITHPDIYPRLIDDFSPKAYDWRPARNRIYIKGETDRIFGIVSAVPKSTIVYNVHINVIPEYRKDFAEEFAHRAIQWIWDNTEAKKLVAEIPEYHQNVVNFAQNVGFQIEGINLNSIQKDGKLYNQIYLGLSNE